MNKLVTGLKPDVEVGLDPLAQLRPQLAEGLASPRGRVRNAPVIQRMMLRTTETAAGCWEWKGATNKKGYGHIRRDMGGPLQSVHRASWEHFVGPIPSDREIDHLCFNIACVNPSHLRLATRLENVRHGRTNQNDGKPTCKSNHPFDFSNTRIDRTGKRVCRTCVRDYMRVRRAEASR